MLGEQHSILTSFPEYQEAIEKLLKIDLHFYSLVSQYNELDHKLVSLEEVGTPISDDEFRMLKERRVQLKDQLYLMIKGSAND